MNHLKNLGELISETTKKLSEAKDAKKRLEDEAPLTILMHHSISGTFKITEMIGIAETENESMYEVVRSLLIKMLEKSIDELENDISKLTADLMKEMDSK